MKILPRSKEQILKDRLKTITNAEKAGLKYFGHTIYADESQFPTEFYRFCNPKSVKDFKAAIKERNEGNNELYAVHLHDFENLIPTNILNVIVNRKVEKILKEKVSEEMDKKGLSTKIPENVYDPQRDRSERTLRTIYDFSDAADKYADDEGEGYSFDLSKW
jgi:hypothetical protein